MAELIWNINGKYFKDFGVYVSDSKGIMDEPNQKKTDTYDWAEYHGLASNLQSKPKYEAREFELSCWVKGGDWLEMRNNFDAIMVEFRKAGKQRLTLDIFGENTYVWDVNINAKVELKKQIQKGVQVGVFTLKLIEYNPVKKILSTTNSNFQLSFNSPKWVEINIDGKIEVSKGSVNINKKISDRVLTNYAFNGRNYLKNSGFPISKIDGWLSYSNSTVEILANELRLKATGVNARVFNNTYIPLKNTPKDYVLTVHYRSGYFLNNVFARYSPFLSSGDSINVVNSTLISNQDLGGNERISTYLLKTKAKDVDVSFYVGVWLQNSQIAVINKIKLEEGNESTDWSPSPENTHFISIAGNIEEITGLTSNADVLWERL